MGNIKDKLQYTKNAVDDIQAAINEKGIEIDDSIPLELYGEKIREIKDGSGDNGFQHIADYYTLEPCYAFFDFDVMARDVEDVSNRYVLE